MKLKLSTLMVITLGVGVVATALALPELRGKRRRQNTAAAIQSLKDIANAQTLYREGDKDGNGVLEYAPDLASLGRYQLIPAELASGERLGYRFVVRHHTGPPGTPACAQDQFVWSATATPLEPGESGELYLGANMAGLVFYSRDRAIAVEEDGSSRDPAFCDCARH